MAVNKEMYREINELCTARGVTLVAVSKLKPPAEILELYHLGQREFGENYVQELVDKAPQLPPDIRWHFIGHLQRNKVKYIAPFVHLIHGIDSVSLLNEVNKQGAKINRKLPVLLQIHIAEEETKFGLNEKELHHLYENLQRTPLQNIGIKGMMGMASFSDDAAKVSEEFKLLKTLYDKFKNIEIANSAFEYLSMGMSGDYIAAINAGSTMIRIGSLLFGARSITD